MTTAVTGTLSVANGGTGAATLTANNVLLGNGTSAVQVVAPGTSGNVLTSNGTTWASTAPSGGTFYRTKVFTAGTTYTTPSDVIGLYVFVGGATGGRNINGATSRIGGTGGGGYSEIYYSSPASSYTYTIGAGGSTAPTAGGTTTWGAISVTGSAGVSTATGGAGGVASGGTFNANGGSGGTGANGSYGATGGGGGGGSRAGVGGNGSAANASTSTGGGGGGTGGNNASGATGGAAATAKAAGAITLPFNYPTESFQAGSNGSVGDICNSGRGGNGASGEDNFSGANISNLVYPGLLSAINGGRSGSADPSNAVGLPGTITIVEVCKA